MSVETILKEEFSLSETVIRRIIQLIDEGNTIPFIARYRKEQTNNLDDQVLRRLDERLQALRSIAAHQDDITRKIEKMGLMTPALAQAIKNTRSITELDDVYRPFRPKRKTRASIARSRGLQPLADALLEQPEKSEYLDRIADRACREQTALESPEDAFQGASDIIAEQFSDDAWVRRRLRHLMLSEGLINVKAKTEDPGVYTDYCDYHEPVSKIAGHRILAINRGEREKILAVHIDLPADRVFPILRNRLTLRPSAAEPWLTAAVQDAWKRLLKPSLETDVRRSLTEKAEAQAIGVFAANLKSLLMQPPVRGYRVLGLDPGYRTGVKAAVVDETGRVLDVGAIYPTPPNNAIDEATRTVLSLVDKHKIRRIAIGNGTASRETEDFIRVLVRDNELPVQWFIVNESGASVYSASKAGAEEFPDFDVTLRSAISIARRLQDPLAEWVKIEPRSIGVGQYQHDLNQKRLDHALKGVVESCVNEVGVELNTASVSLLSYVAGLGSAMAARLVKWREENGPFQSRRFLLEVPGIGKLTFQQCAGFLRIPDSDEPLDNTSVHPEAYEAVYNLASLFDQPVSPTLVQVLRHEPVEKLAERVNLGVPTLQDILAALEKPGRDPRGDETQMELDQDVRGIEDLKPEMKRQGIVRNVTDFGAFVDIGVHQDGLVHISELSEHYVRHPLDVVQPGQNVIVRVLQVDQDRKRIALSMKQKAPARDA